MIDPADLKDFAPSGTLQAGIVVALTPSAIFAALDAKGEPYGVPVDILRSFAAALNLPMKLHVFSNSGLATDAVADAVCDVAFMPRDAAREARLDFGPAYYMIESTYLVPAGSSVTSIGQINSARMHIVAIANTTTARSAKRTAPLATVEEVSGVDVMTARAQRGEGDAFALSHDSFIGMLPSVPGARVLSGNFQQTGVAAAVPKGRPGALRLVTTLLADAKASGVVRRALDAQAFHALEVAP